jgi:hypothetical protein
VMLICRTEVVIAEAGGMCRKRLDEVSKHQSFEIRCGGLQNAVKPHATPMGMI